MNFKNLSGIQMDVLREIGNIGAGNAATSMSELIDKRVDMLSLIHISEPTRRRD